MSTAIIYYSRHHGNTKKVLDAIASDHEVTLIDITQTPDPDLSSYDTIGIASGIYFSKFEKNLTKYVQTSLPMRRKVFLIYTGGMLSDKFFDEIRTAVEYRFGHIIGTFGCKGFDTFGPFKLVGGIAKGHPDAEDLAQARAFYDSLNI